MEIIAHRGYWVNPKEKNTVIAFTRALKNGFGIETDFRDLNGELVVSHDIPTAGAIKVVEFVDIYKSHPVSAPMALNIKSDGLHGLIHEFIADAKFKSVFVFDMAVPDMRGYLKNHIPTFARLSEYEPHPAFLKDCKGVWLDAFESEWYGVEKINSLLNQMKKIVIVSPELHGRPHLALWGFIRAHDFHRNDLISICTDFPKQAKEYFYAKD
jgi:hypothetical protein